MVISVVTYVTDVKFKYSQIYSVVLLARVTTVWDARYVERVKHVSMIRSSANSVPCFLFFILIMMCPRKQ